MSTLLHYPLADLESSGGGHTAREIAQQPDLWREISTARVAARQADEAFLRPLLDRPDLRIVLTGAGSSAFAGAGAGARACSLAASPCRRRRYHRHRVQPTRVLGRGRADAARVLCPLGRQS